jgi:hypothetical protein
MNVNGIAKGSVVMYYDLSEFCNCCQTLMGRMRNNSNPQNSKLFNKTVNSVMKYL